MLSLHIEPTDSMKQSVLTLKVVYAQKKNNYLDEWHLPKALKQQQLQAALL